MPYIPLDELKKHGSDSFMRKFISLAERDLYFISGFGAYPKFKDLLEDPEADIPGKVLEITGRMKREQAASWTFGWAIAYMKENGLGQPLMEIYRVANFSQEFVEEHVGLVSATLNFHKELQRLEEHGKNPMPRKTTGPFSQYSMRRNSKKD